MAKNDVTPEEMAAVCGQMLACRAADYLGITLARFYYLAQRYSLSTAFLQKGWSAEDDEELRQLVKAGHLQKNIAKMMGRNLGSIRCRVAKHNRIKRISEVK